MSPQHTPELIAERTLVANSDPAHSVVIQVYKPVRVTPTEYSCSYRIISAARTAEREIFGVDSFQALRLALSLVDSEIARIDEPEEIVSTDAPRPTPPNYPPA